MFRRVLIFFALSVCAFHVFGNAKADELRKNMYQAPDSAKAAVLVDIARVFQYENTDSCMFYAQKALEKAYSMRQYPTVTDACTLMSQIALEKKDYVKATALQKTVLELAIRERYWDLAADSYNAIAQTWLLRNNYAEAVEYLRQGLQIAKDRNNLEMQKYFYQSLIDAYRHLRNINAVCEYYPQLLEVSRSIDAEAYNRHIEALQTERETLTAAAEEARNRWQQRSTVSKVFQFIAIAWAVLATALLIMAYVWYRFKLKPEMSAIQNELSVKTSELESIIRYQENSFKFLTSHIHTDIDALKQNIGMLGKQYGNIPVAENSLLNRISNDISALYDFFQNFILLLQAQSGQLQPVITAVNIPQMAAHLLADCEKQSVARNITLINDVQNHTFALADEHLVETILRNILANAFRFAPEKTGRITMGSKVGTKINTSNGTFFDDSYIEIWITDDGTTLTTEQAELIFELDDSFVPTEKPTEKDYGASMAVCKTVVETLKGRIWVETLADEGFSIRLSLPRAGNIEVNTQNLLDSANETVCADEPVELPLLLSQ